MYGLTPSGPLISSMWTSGPSLRMPAGAGTDVELSWDEETSGTEVDTKFTLLSLAPGKVETTVK